MNDTNNPKVFISYSWDNEKNDDHKNWVKKLATDLVRHGVDVILDQWDVRLGNDLAFFMEQGLPKSQLVICICSEQYAAKAIRHFPKIGVGEFLLEAGELKTGDEIVISGPTTGAIIMTVGELRFDLRPVDKVTKGQLFSMPVPEKIRPSDRLYIWKRKDK